MDAEGAGRVRARSSALLSIVFLLCTAAAGAPRDLVPLPPADAFARSVDAGAASLGASLDGEARDHAVAVARALEVSLESVGPAWGATELAAVRAADEESFRLALDAAARRPAGPAQTARRRPVRVG